MADIISQTINIFLSYPLTILAFMVAGAFLMYIIAAQVTGQRIGTLVFLSFLVIGIAAMIFGLIVDPQVARAFQENPLAGVLAVASSFAIGPFVIIMTITVAASVIWGMYN